MVSRMRVLTILLVVALAMSFVAGCITPWSPAGKNQRSGPGDDALLFIKGSPYSNLVIVIQHVPGYAPNAEAVNVLKATAKEVLDKKTVEVVTEAVIPKKGDEYVYSLREVNDIEKDHRTRYHDGDTAVMYFLYLDGRYESDTGSKRVLGAAYHGSSIVMFKNNLRKTAEANQGGIPGITSASKEQLMFVVERAVLVHEMGHLLGLVDNGIPMVKNHKDTHPDAGDSHSSNQESVMYWAVESSSGISKLLGANTNIPYKFDADDKADIEAAKKS